MQIAGMGQYAHGNQPIQHMIYLYDYAREPWKAQYWVRETMNRLYKATPDGYCGDEDKGQTSAWYVFSALGFYPVTPASDQYALGAPLFRRVTVHLENGKTLTIGAGKNSAASRYVQALRVNGVPCTHNWVSHRQLEQGADLEFTMSPTPNRQRGIGDADRPYSMSTAMAPAASATAAISATAAAGTAASAASATAAASVAFGAAADPATSSAAGVPDEPGPALVGDDIRDRRVPVTQIDPAFENRSQVRQVKDPALEVVDKMFPDRLLICRKITLEELHDSLVLFPVDRDRYRAAFGKGEAEQISSIGFKDP